MAKVYHNQSLLDLSVQYDGSVLSTFHFAVNNGISITDDLTPGQDISNTPSEFRKNDVANFFKDKNQLIATKIGIQQTLEIGIGKMRIGNDFTVT